MIPAEQPAEEAASSTSYNIEAQANQEIKFGLLHTSLLIMLEKPITDKQESEFKAYLEIDR